MDSEYTRLQVEGDEPVRMVTISRPQDRNSFDSTLMAEITGLMDELEASEARAIIFTGDGEEYFIGGADGCEMMLCDPDSAMDFSRRFQAVLNLLESSRLITVAAINGLCFGGGFEFALACDLRVASTRAKIGLPEVKVGLIPGGGGTQRLPRLVGQGLAMEMILSGKLYPGAKAVEMGLVNRVADPDELIQIAHDLLKPILRQPHYALALAKAAVRRGLDTGLDEGLKIESDKFSRCFERDYFPKLMIDQLQSGSLATSHDKDELIRRAKG